MCLNIYLQFCLFLAVQINLVAMYNTVHIDIWLFKISSYKRCYDTRYTNYITIFVCHPLLFYLIFIYYYIFIILSVTVNKTKQLCSQISQWDRPEDYYDSVGYNNTVIIAKKEKKNHFMIWLDLKITKFTGRKTMFSWVSYGQENKWPPTTQASTHPPTPPHSVPVSLSPPVSEPKSQKPMLFTERQRLTAPKYSPPPDRQL